MLEQNIVDSQGKLGTGNSSIASDTNEMDELERVYDPLYTIPNARPGEGRTFNTYGT